MMPAEHGMLNFKVDGLQCLVFLNQHHFQSLHIKLSTLSENKDPWNMEDLQVVKHLYLSFRKNKSLSYRLLKYNCLFRF